MELSLLWLRDEVFMWDSEEVMCPPVQRRPTGLQGDPSGRDSGPLLIHIYRLSVFLYLTSLY